MTRRTFLTAAFALSRKSHTLEPQFEARCRQHGIPGLSALILQNAKPVWTWSYGFQDLQGRIPASPETPYRIASLTKTFASTLAMQLVEAGRLDLDVPIRDLIPPEHPLKKTLDDPAIHIRHVLSHTSEGVPGTVYKYNGGRYVAVGLLLEKITGKPFRDLLVARILDPLGMTRSVPGQDATAARYQQVLAEIAKPYAVDQAGHVVPSEYPARRISSAAGMISTVHDLARYDVALDRHRLISARTQELAWTPVNSLPYGLGWFVQRTGGYRLVWHYGYQPGSFSALYIKIPERRATLLLLANSDGLSRPFPGLAAGDITSSPFAGAFLNLV